MGYNFDIMQYFVENWKTFLDDYETLLNTDLIKSDDLLTVLNSVENDTQSTMELNENKLPFLDILITKSGKKNSDEYLFKTNRFKTLCLLSF